MEKCNLFTYVGVLSTILIITVTYESVWVTYETKKNIYLIQKHHRYFLEKDETCRDIFEVRKVHRNMSERTNLTVLAVSKAKEEQSYLRSLYYEVISYESPSMVRKEQQQQDGVTTGTNFTIKKEWRLHQVNGQLAHLPCRLREYSPKDVQECAVKRTSAGKGKTHLLYIGDSRIRQHVEVITELLKPLNPKITNDKGEILSIDGLKRLRKYKKNFKVESDKLPGFLLEFNWAALIDWGETPKRVIDQYSYSMNIISAPWETDSYYYARPSEKDRNNTRKDILRYEIGQKNASGKVYGTFPEGHLQQEGYGTLLDKSHNNMNSNTTAGNSNPLGLREHTIVNEPSGIIKARVGAIDKLRRLLATPKEKLPDIILLNTGVWFFFENYKTHLKAIDHSSILPIHALSSLLSKLAKLTTVVWVAPDPFKEFVFPGTDDHQAYTLETEVHQEWLLNAQSLLQHQGVLFWDSFLPVAYKSRSDCEYIFSENVNFSSLPMYRDFDPIISWNCLDRRHLGFEVLSVATHMTLNHVCNPYLPDGYCCSD